MLLCSDNSTGPREKCLTFIAGLSHLHVFLPPSLESFSVCFSSYALWTLFLSPHLLPCCTGSVVYALADQLSIMFPPTPPPCYPWFPPLHFAVASRQGGLWEQLHHGGQQVGSAEYGGGGGGMHVQVPHHPLRLHHTWAAQSGKLGE